MSSCSAWRWVTSAMGPPSATAALSALTLFSRPTWSGTIISGKMTVSRSATRGRSRGPVTVSSCGSSTGSDGRLAIVGFSCVAALWIDWRSVNGRPSIDRATRWSLCWWMRTGGARRGCRRRLRSLGIERLEDPRSEPLFELEEDADAGKVDTAFAGQMADPQDAPDVVLAVETDVGRRSGRAEEALVLVDPQRARMSADDARRDADDVDRASRITLCPGVAGHAQDAKTLTMPLSRVCTTALG